MHRLFGVSCLSLLLASVALAQSTPTPDDPSGWKVVTELHFVENYTDWVQYYGLPWFNGTATSDATWDSTSLNNPGAFVWQYRGVVNLNNSGTYSRLVTSMRGKVKITATWIKSTPAPTYVDLRVRSAVASGGYSQITKTPSQFADRELGNGLDDIERSQTSTFMSGLPQPDKFKMETPRPDSFYGQYPLEFYPSIVHGNRLVRLQANNGTATMEYTAFNDLTSANDSDECNLTMAIWPAYVDNRHVDITTDYPFATTFKRAITGRTASVSIPRLNGGDPAVFTFDEAVRAPQDPPTAVGNARHVDIGLNNGMEWAFPGETRALAPFPITYTPVVSVTQSPGFSTGGWDSYSFNESLYELSCDFLGLGSITASYHRPALRQNWSGYSNQGGRLLSLEHPRNDAGKDDLVSLHYVWSDGAVSDASVTTHFHSGPTDNEKYLGIVGEADTTVPASWLPFASGDEWSPIIQKSMPCVNEPTPVSWSTQAGVASLGFSFASTVGTAVEVAAIDASMGFAAVAMAGLAIALTPPTLSNVDVDYLDGAETTFSTRDAAIVYADSQGRVYPANPRRTVRAPRGTPLSEYFCRWKAASRPYVNTRYYVADYWNGGGYDKQGIVHTTSLGTLVEGRKFYYFWFDTDGGAPPQFGLPPTTAPNPMPGGVNGG